MSCYNNIFNNLLVLAIICLILVWYFSCTKSSFVSERALSLSDVAKKVFSNRDDYTDNENSFSKFKKFARKGGNDIDAAEYTDIYGLWQKNDLNPQSVSRVVDF